VRWVRHGNVSLLHHAALNDFAELTGWLIQHGADTEIFSSPSSSTPAYTPLMMACKFNCTRSACVLVNAGANVNVRVHDGLKGGGDLTPLHIAIQLGHMDLAAFLFSRGASNTCTFGCTKCRLHSTMLRRRLDTMRANIQARVATEEREAARRRELEEVLEDQEAMEGMSFDEFVAEMRKLDDRCQPAATTSAAGGAGGGGQRGEGGRRHHRMDRGPPAAAAVGKQPPTDDGAAPDDDGHCHDGAQSEGELERHGRRAEQEAGGGEEEGEEGGGEEEEGGEEGASSAGARQQTQLASTAKYARKRGGKKKKKGRSRR
jgi:hypothetical protein